MKKALAFLLIFAAILLIACVPVQETKAGTSGGKQQETQQTTSISQQKRGVSREVKEVLERRESRVKNIFYKYKGPQTGDNFYDFYIKGNKIKYNPYLEIKTLDQPDSYDTIFIDKDTKTAASYCMAAYCTYQGKKQDLNYDDAYISTIFDWVTGLAYAEKVGEEVIDDRNTWKLDTDKGILWVDTFYGIPLKIESSGKFYRFQQISVNSVQDSDVMAS